MAGLYTALSNVPTVACCIHYCQQYTANDTQCVSTFAIRVLNGDNMLDKPVGILLKLVQHTNNER